MALLPGFGMLRRFVTLAFVAGAFWAGMHMSRLSYEDSCLDAGGAVRPDGLCRGIP
ncbi:MAG: hypothetical protein AAGK71_06755 [Pseudomonadota bacterium]